MPGLIDSFVGFRSFHAREVQAIAFGDGAEGWPAQLLPGWASTKGEGLRVIAQTLRLLSASRITQLAAECAKLLRCDRLLQQLVADARLATAWIAVSRLSAPSASHDALSDAAL
ncbi:MAG TPA: hypothetical protein VNM92_15300 [Thermoanaerobaculia bacterium]|nr:hypothetical protein [Thermoanaerobaculia bacterium]